MEFIKTYKKEIIFFSIFFLIILAIAGWFYFVIYLEDKEVEEKTNQGFDLSDVNNVDAVESRLDYKMKISQGYLLTYTTNKSGIWYMSSAIVSKIKLDGTDAFITLTNDDKTHKLIAEISSDKVNVKKGDSINFVGTIDLETGNIELAKISKDTINYKNVKKMEFTKLVDNIKKVKDINSSPVGYKYMVFLTIQVDGEMTTKDSHSLADCLEMDIKRIDKVYKAIVHVEPYTA